MPFTLINFYRGAVTGTLTTAYTHASNGGTRFVRSARVVNGSDEDGEFSMYIVPNAGTFSDGVAFVNRGIVPARGVANFRGEDVINTTGQTIQIQGVGSRLGCSINGGRWP